MIDQKWFQINNNLSIRLDFFSAVLSFISLRFFAFPRNLYFFFSVLKPFFIFFRLWSLRVVETLSAVKHRLAIRWQKIALSPLEYLCFLMCSSVAVQQKQNGSKRIATANKFTSSFLKTKQIKTKDENETNRNNKMQIICFYLIYF